MFALYSREQSSTYYMGGIELMGVWEIKEKRDASITQMRRAAELLHEVLVDDKVNQAFNPLYLEKLRRAHASLLEAYLDISV